VPSLTDVLRDVIDQRESLHRTEHPALVVGRNQDGTLQLRRMDGECVGRGAYSGAATGEVVNAPIDLHRDVGAAGVAGISQRGSVGGVWLESIEPNVFNVGDTYTAVIVRGRGFREGITALDLLLPDSRVINADIMITEIRYVSPEELELDLVVASTARVFGWAAGPDGLEEVFAAIAYDNPGERL
jgi:hypothetical protein